MIANPQHLKPMQSTLQASLHVNGRLVSEGHAQLYRSLGSGMFWPIDEKALDTPYPEARLNVIGISDAVDIRDVCQSGSPFHWEFLIADGAIFSRAESRVVGGGDLF